MLEEVWKPIKGYEGYYEISNFGKIKSLPKYIPQSRGGFKLTKEKILKTNTLKGGYLQVTLYKDTKRKTCLVHRLVAETFIPNPNNFTEINHKDENPSNNIVSNLEYCTSKYNSNYGTRNERMGKNLTNHPNLSKRVLQFDLNGNFIKEWESVHECKRNGYNQGNISACCRGERNKAHNCLWKYKD